MSNQKTKRYRTPKLQDGELRIYFGKLPHENPDVIYAWQGDAGMKRDANLLVSTFGSQKPDPHVKPIFSKMLPSLLEDLVSRGYDLETLSFSIRKKQTEQPVNPAS